MRDPARETTMRNGAGMCIVLVIAALVLTGCLGFRNIPLPVPGGPVLLVDYQRSGGIAGLSDRLVVFDNGAGLVSSRTTSREIQLNATELEQITTIFAKAKFADLEGNYTSRRGGADLMQYSISYRGMTVNTEDTAVPADLEPVIADLNRILDNGLSGRQDSLPAPATTS